MPRGHGYMLNPNSNKVIQERMLQDRLGMLEAREHELGEKLKKHEAEKEIEKQQLKDTIRREMMG